MAVIYPEISKNSFQKGEIIFVPIYLDTQNEEINALEVKVKFSSNLEFRDYFEGKSIISFWIEKPHLISNEVIFSGIIPGGFVGKRAEIINLVFKAKEAGEAKIDVSLQSKVLLNDGLGTEAKLIAKNVSLQVLPSEIKTKYEIKDNFPPEPFKIYLVRNPNVFDGKYYIVFEAKDKQTGIAYYEITEKPILWGKIDFSSLQFKQAQSPYVLEDQSLRSYIVVKAVDRAGNERIEVLRPQKMLLFEDVFIFTLGIIFIFLVSMVVLKLKYANRRE